MNLTSLAQRLIACKHFRWMPRMRVFAEREGTLWYQTIPERFAEPSDGRLWLPDLEDPATLGCLLALVREAHKQPNAYARLRRNPRSFEGLHWEVLANAEEWRESALGHGSTEAAALVAALEASPCPEVTP